MIFGSANVLFGEISFSSLSQMWGLGSRTLVMYKILCINMQFDDSSLMSVGEYRKPQNWPFCKHGTHQYTARRLAGEISTQLEDF